MNRSTLGLVAFCAGVAVLGFAAGQYSEGRKHAPVPRVPPPPPPPPPEYSVRATFDPVPPIREAPVPLPPGGLEAALDEQDAFHRTATLAALLPTLGPEAVPEVKAVLTERKAELGVVELSLLARFWGTHGQGEAAAWVIEECPAAHKPNVFLAAIEPWARRDAPAAGAVVRQFALLPLNDIRDTERALVRIWFETGQPGLAEYIHGLGLTINRQRALRAFFVAAVERDGREPPARWAEAIPNEDKKFKLDAFRQLGSALGQLDPAGGVAWCEAHCAGPFGLGLRRVIAQQWAAHDGPAAMAWLSKAPVDEQRDLAIQKALVLWSIQDPTGLHAWLAQMDPADPPEWFRAQRGPAATALITGWPALAMQWAQAIDDPEARERVSIGMLRRWRKRDADAAETWLANSDWPAEWQRRARAEGPGSPAAGTAPAEPGGFATPGDSGDLGDPAGPE